MTLFRAVAVALLLILFTTSSNCSVPIDQFFPYGTAAGDSRAAATDDGYSGPLVLSVPFPFFNDTYNRLWVNNNGGISFINGISTYTPTCGALPPSSVMIAPFWADIDIRQRGNIFFRQSTTPDLIDKAEDDISSAFPDIVDVSISWLFIATFDEVPFYGATSTCDGLNKRNTFQVILATNGNYTFNLFYYNKLQWTTGTASGGDCYGLGGSPAKAGFDVGDGETFYELPGSCTQNILRAVSSSNVGSLGKWIFRIDSGLEDGTCDFPPCDGQSTTPQAETNEPEPSTGSPPLPTTTRPPTGNFSCEGLPAGEYPNPDDCTTFWYCVDEHPEAILTPCPPGLHFNPVLLVCDEPEDAGCEVKHRHNHRKPLAVVDLIHILNN